MVLDNGVVKDCFQEYSHTGGRKNKKRIKEKEQLQEDSLIILN